MRMFKPIDYRENMVYIYFIRCTVTGLIKIGFTTDVKKRFDSLNSQGSTELELIGFMMAKQSEEKSLHARFQRFRARGNGSDRNKNFFHILMKLNIS